MNSKIPIGLVLLALASSGCATARIHQRAGEHLYDRPIAELWPEVRTFFAEKGWATTEVTGQYLLMSEWGDELNGEVYTRYIVQAVAAGPDRTAVRVHRQSKQLGDGKPYWKLTKRPEQFIKTTLGKPRYDRALDLEWELLRKVASVDAQQIEAAATK
jgi:hypothetical protein